MWHAMWKKLVPFISILVLQVGPQDAEGSTIHAFAGPYIIYTDAFYMCEGEYHWTWNLKTTHFNPAKPHELQRIWGWVNGTVSSLADTNWLKMVMDVRNNNMWKENAFVFNHKNGGCSALRTFLPDFYHRVFHQNQTGPCVLPPNFYDVHKGPINWVVPVLPVMPYGTYRFRVKAGLAGNDYPEACFIVEVHIIPKT